MADAGIVAARKAITRIIFWRFQAWRHLLVAGNGRAAADARHRAAEFARGGLCVRPGSCGVVPGTDVSVVFVGVNHSRNEGLFRIERP